MLPALCARQPAVRARSTRLLEEHDHIPRLKPRPRLAPGVDEGAVLQVWSGSRQRGRQAWARQRGRQHGRGSVRALHACAPVAPGAAAERYAQEGTGPCQEPDSDPIAGQCVKTSGSLPSTPSFPPTVRACQAWPMGAHSAVHTAGACVRVRAAPCVRARARCALATC